MNVLLLIRKTLPQLPPVKTAPNAVSEALTLAYARQYGENCAVTTFERSIDLVKAIIKRLESRDTENVLQDLKNELSRLTINSKDN